jgi:hypothetical protein
MAKKVVTGLVRFAYFNGFKARLNELSGKTEFSTQVLIPKSDTATIAALKAAVAEALADKFNGKRPPGARNPIKDGDAPVADGAKELGEEYAGHWYISAKCSEDRAPQVVDSEGQDILSSKEFGSGDWGRVSVTAFGYDQKVNKGVSFWLNNVQFLEKGEPLSGRSNAADDFGTPAPTAAKPAAPAKPAAKAAAPAKGKKAPPPPADDDEGGDDGDDEWA